MSWVNDKDALDKAFDELIGNIFVKGPESFRSKVEVSAELEPLYAIQAYITNGLLYPLSYEGFEKDIPESAFEPLNTILPRLYPETKKSIVAVAKSCKFFNDNVLNKLLSYPNMMIVYAETALNLIQDEDGLLDQVNILIDSSNPDSAYNAALEIVKDNLDQMKREAETKKGQTDSLKEKLEAFLTETRANRQLVDDINGQYSRPLTVKGKKYDTAVAYLDADLAGLEKAEQDALEEKEALDKKRENFRDPAHWRFYVALLDGMAVSQLVLNREHACAVEKLKNAKSNTSRIYNCRRYVLCMSRQFESLLPRMKNAIRALESLGCIFNTQAQKIELLVKSLDRIERGRTSPNSSTRQSNMRNGIKKAIENYKKVKESALEFEKNARLRVKVEQQ